MNTAIYEVKDAKFGTFEIALCKKHATIPAKFVRETPNYHCELCAYAESKNRTK